MGVFGHTTMRLRPPFSPSSYSALSLSPPRCHYPPYHPPPGSVAAWMMLASNAESRPGVYTPVRSKGEPRNRYPAFARENIWIIDREALRRKTALYSDFRRSLFGGIRRCY